jgi:hypothetical protein
LLGRIETVGRVSELGTLLERREPVAHAAQ